jgi:RHS repeat-associated protein
MNRSPTGAYYDTRGFDWSGTCWFTFDERGNTTMVTDGYGMEGGILSLRQYDSFGNSEQGLAEQRPHYVDFNPFDGFGGQWGYQTDRETGLVLCGQRYYDPSAGRWISRDPIGYDGGVNVYAYCANNAVGKVDPSGTGPWSDRFIDPDTGLQIDVGWIVWPTEAATWNNTVHFGSLATYYSFKNDRCWQAHEYWHMVQQRRRRQNGFSFVIGIVWEYIKYGSHDGAPSERDADANCGCKSWQPKGPQPAPFAYLIPPLLR